MSTPILDLEHKVARLEASNRELRRALNRTIRLLRMTAETATYPGTVHRELLEWLGAPWAPVTVEELGREQAESGGE